MLLAVHKNTLRNWLKVGLLPVDDRRPILILGRQLSSFLHAGARRKLSVAALASSTAFGAGRQRPLRLAEPTICRSRRHQETCGERVLIVGPACTGGSRLKNSRLLRAIWK